MVCSGAVESSEGYVNTTVPPAIRSRMGLRPVAKISQACDHTGDPCHALVAGSEGNMKGKVEPVTYEPLHPEATVFGSLRHAVP